MSFIARNIPNQTELERAFSYHQDSGKLYRKRKDVSSAKNVSFCKMWNSRYADKEAGTNFQGYVSVHLNGKIYLAHRIIWVMNKGEIPNGFIVDHIDGDRANNRLSNLRLATQKANLRNQGKNAGNSSGVPGVYWVGRVNRWRAMCKTDRKIHHLGYFEEKRDAIEAAANFRRSNGFTERHICGV